MTLSTYDTAVKPEWIDYNGHMSEAFYVLVFGFATDEAMAAVGLDEDYRAATGCSLYTVEAHVRYLDEVGLGTELHVSTEIIGAAAKKLHIAHTMVAGDAVVATEEILALHVGQREGRTEPLPEAVQQRVQAALSDAPAWAGRRVLA
ncbi:MULTISPECIES: thioesterase family protein [unclassified Microbacterium]|uniref:thioesterase family protein n=1 Tax=unclassified Microbacterium TaxID=2609290 RepID=UPI00097EC8C7|nr:thioesterase family protein [Microbacterium sp. JB110]RCS60417.1 thioesterase [Microbacterium sp. JB110]SJM65004.1 3-hydroxyacyl-CoA dehydrogenase [Frigoribacterium sp. JB110]